MMNNDRELNSIVFKAHDIANCVKVIHSLKKKPVLVDSNVHIGVFRRTP